MGEIIVQAGFRPSTFSSDFSSKVLRRIISIFHTCHIYEYMSVGEGIIAFFVPIG